MEEAEAKAKASTGTLLELLCNPRESASVNLRFVSSSDQEEYLWADILEVLSPQELSVRLVSRPVTHSGKLDRLYRCGINDVEDWQVRDADDILHGGFTQRAMFAIARRDGLQLPKKLLAHELEYRRAVER